ncbi:MAG TPA: OmpH family outer membrane protein [Burkholderiales bacterium]
MKRFLLILAAICAGAVAAPALAQSKIAVVNLDRIMHESKQSKDAEKRLESQFKQKQAALNDFEASLRKSSDAFDKDSLTMSEAQRRDRQNQLADQGRELQRRQRDLRDEYGQRNQAEVAEVFSAANRAIKSVAEKEGIDVVFQEVAYANPKIDITDKVLKAMSDGTPAAK